MPDRDATTATATFGAGCYWGTEKWYAKDPRAMDAPEGAVIATSVGRGPARRDREPDVPPGAGASGHVEVCQVKYDPRKCSYGLARHLFTFHDPTTPDRQADRGRSTRP